jgi:hypothetical protein
MIPKKIHYCWFGEKAPPEYVSKCMETWKKHCPDYEIIRWDEKNYNVNKIPYTKEAYEAKRYAFVSDYARLDIIYNQGGIYLDTDVELIKPLDELLNYPCYMGMELKGRVATGLGFGGAKGNEIVSENMNIYKRKNFIVDGKIDDTTCVTYTTEVLSGLGLRPVDEIQDLGDIVILPTEYLCPLNPKNNKLTITENTVSIHHYKASWYEGSDHKKRLRKTLTPLLISMRSGVDKLFGLGTYDKIKNKLKGI